MSRTCFVEFRGKSFWAYDVALSVFLKHLIDVATLRQSEPETDWLAKAISEWRIIAAVQGTYGLHIDEQWS
jgi:hypothetical protein